MHLNIDLEKVLKKVIVNVHYLTPSRAENPAKRRMLCDRLRGSYSCFLLLPCSATTTNNVKKMRRMRLRDSVFPHEHTFPLASLFVYFSLHQVGTAKPASRQAGKREHGASEQQLAISCLWCLPPAGRPPGTERTRPALRSASGSASPRLRDQHARTHGAHGTMKAAIMFNAIAHATTLYYYMHILRAIAAIDAEPTTTIVRDFLDFKAKFFTMWGVAAQMVLFALCVLHDVSRVFPADHAVRRGARSLRDLVLVAVAAPGALTVSAMFWSLFKLDRDMVMPAELDALIPTWLNHTMHTFVVALVLVQMLSEPHHAPSKTATLTVGILFSLAYNFVLFHEYWLSRRWIYPVFSILSWPGRVGLAGFTSAMFIGLSLVVRSFIKAHWGPPPKINHRSIKKHN